MRIGEFEILAARDLLACGPSFGAVGPHGRCELRLLTGVRTDDGAWREFLRRQRLLELVEHPAVLRPIALEIGGDTPHMALPERRALPKAVPHDTLKVWATSLANAMRLVHRLGIAFGQLTRDDLGLTPDGAIVAELSGTRVPAPIAFEPDDDVAALGRLLKTLSEPSAHGGQSNTLIELIELLRGGEGERPNASAVADWLADTATPSDGVTRAADGFSYTRIPTVGSRLGRFTLQEKLGEGAVGVVFRAEDAADGRTVAVKVLLENRLSSPQTRKRFLKEARLLKAVRTPYVAGLVDAGEENGVCYLAMEYVAGENLLQRLRSGPLPERDALRLVGDAARGLAAAHAAGVVHRDVKPANMLVCEAPSDGVYAKMVDFGLARQIEQNDSLAMTGVGAVLGTPLYMAPEQFGDGVVDSRSDVYALGASLYHVLAGRPPFEQTNIAQLMHQHLTVPPPSLERAAVPISSATARLVAHALEKRADRRPVDAGAFLQAIERILRGEPTVAGDHPRLPGAGRVYRYEWTLTAEPHELWPLVSNTERLNRAIGLPAVAYRLLPNPSGGAERRGSARVGGMAMEWREHPFEWIENRRLGVLREFARGPFRWFASVVELVPNPNGGTRLVQTLKAAPRGLFGKLAVAVELGVKSKRNLGAVYARIDRVAVGGRLASTVSTDAFEAVGDISPEQRQRLGAGIVALAQDERIAAAADALGHFLARAGAQDLARIRPLAIATRSAVTPDAAIAACLRAVPLGLLLLKWDIICPLCRIPSGRRDTLAELRDHEHCPACNAEFATDFASSVELVFESHPDIRAADVRMFCAGGPSHSPHVVAQARVAPGETLELNLALSAGTYLLRGPQLTWTADLEIVATAALRKATIELGPNAPALPTLGPAGQCLSIFNSADGERILRVERTAARGDALTAAMVAGHPDFRRLFPHETLSPGMLAPAASITMLVARPIGDWRDSDGADVARFATLRQFFQTVEQLATARGGAVVKTVDDAIVVVFQEVARAVRLALALPDELARGGETKRVAAAIGIHRGLVLVATINDRLDYYGQTVRLARRLGETAEGGNLLISATSASDPAAYPLLSPLRPALDEVAFGESQPALVYRVSLPMPQPSEDGT